MKIRPLVAADYPTVAQIYAEGIATKMATFETEVPNWTIWNTKYHPFCRFVAEVGGQIGGWIAISPISKRYCYRGVAEVSVYVGKDFRGQKIGKTLLAHLVRAATNSGIWTLQAGIFANNKVSIKMHEQQGFRVLGVREKIAQLDGIWCDNVLMERRSKL